MKFKLPRDERGNINTGRITAVISTAVIAFAGLFSIAYLVKTTISLFNGGFNIDELTAVGTFIVSVFGSGVAGLVYNRAKDFAASRNKDKE